MRTSVDLHVWLVSNGVAHEFFRLEERARTVEDAVDAVASASEFARPTMLVAPTGEAALAVTPADASVDVSAVERLSGIHGLRPARPLASARLSGFPAGWESPVSLDDAIPTVLDATLAGKDVIYGPAGEPGLLVAIRTADLVGAGVLVESVTSPIASRM